MPSQADIVSEPIVVGRYRLFAPLASGGMATVHLGRLLGDAGFERVVAIKRLHPELAGDPELAGMLIDEARLAARIRHPNVVPPLDVISHDGELLVVMEYVEGESLSGLLRAARAAGVSLPQSIVSGIGCAVLNGLHAAHEARAKDGTPLGIIHRDVSPQNVLVGVDGVARVIDFGIAKAVGTARAVSETADGRVKGKLAYMAPEQLRGAMVTRRADIFATGIVLWECIVGKRLFSGDGDVAMNVLERPIRPPSELVEGVSPELDRVVLTALERDPSDRFASALELAIALEAAVAPAPAREIGACVRRLAAAELERRSELVSRLEHAAVPEAITRVESARVVKEEGTLGRLSGAALSKRERSKTSSLRLTLGLGAVGLVVFTGLAVVVASPGSDQMPATLRAGLRELPALPERPAMSAPVPSEVERAPATPPPSAASGAAAPPRATRAPAPRSAPAASAGKIPLFSRD